MEEVYTTMDIMKRDIHELEKQKYDLIKKNEALRMENENLKKQLFESTSSGQNFLTEQVSYLPVVQLDRTTDF